MPAAPVATTGGIIAITWLDQTDPDEAEEETVYQHYATPDVWDQWQRLLSSPFGPDDTVDIPNVCHQQVASYGLWTTPLAVAAIPHPGKPERGEGPHTHIDLLYLAVVAGGDVTVLYNEVGGVVFASADDLGQIDVREDVPGLHEAALAALAAA